ncbi:MAG TPA: MBL fold metallo-hydrolase [Candidatus Cloacimonadota bacterium]|nr:MBL fold metallo-hydrolase [Candidatus Cloacimonadota bacterium]
MKVSFWGTRGSLPNSITEKQIKKKILHALVKSLDHRLTDQKSVIDFIDQELSFAERCTYGSNTSCVEIIDTKLLNSDHPEFVICDAGSGLRDFGNKIMASEITGATFHIFISHLHWDHIQGFPFFVPAFISANHVRIYGCHPELEEAFICQQSPRYFPLALRDMPGDISFHILPQNEEIEIAGFRIRTIKQDHPGTSWGYSFSKYGKKIVYSTDSEHNEASEQPDYPFLDFIRDADLLIFDAQYSLLQNLDIKKSWGHSSGVIGTELSSKAGVKKLVLFHNEHTFEDEVLEKMLFDTRRYARLIDPNTKLQIELAYDNLEMEV